MSLIRLLLAEKLAINKLRFLSIAITLAKFPRSHQKLVLLRNDPLLLRLFLRLLQLKPLLESEVGLHKRGCFDELHLLGGLLLLLLVLSSLLIVALSVLL